MISNVVERTHIEMSCNLYQQYERPSKPLKISFDMDVVVLCVGFRAAVDMWQNVDDLDGIIGAACSVVCQPVSLLTAALNIPTVSYICTSSALSDQYKYPTFT